MPAPTGTSIFLLIISAASAGPLRGYTNVTSQASDGVFARHDSPSEETSSQTLINGITALPSSLLAGLSEGASTIPSPAGSGSLRSAAESVQATGDSFPTWFQTFGDQNAATTLTVWSTQWTTVPPPTTTGASIVSSSPHSVPRISYDPISSNSTLTTNQVSSTKSCTDSTAGSSQPSPGLENPASESSHGASFLAPPSSTFTIPQPKVPIPISTSSSPPSNQENPTSLPMFGSARLPEVVSEGASATSTQSAQETTKSDNSSRPGITMVPQNPSVIYITTTVTDGGVTTTVTA